MTEVHYRKIEWFETCTIHMTSKHIKIFFTSNFDSQCTFHGRCCTVREVYYDIYIMSLQILAKEVSDLTLKLTIFLTTGSGFNFNCYINLCQVGTLSSNVLLLVRFKLFSEYFSQSRVKFKLISKHVIYSLEFSLKP